MNNKSILLFAILLGLHSSLYSATVTVVGSDGAAGLNGSTGDPGTPGGNGGGGVSATAVSITSTLNQDTQNIANATGGDGNRGGNGGNGFNLSPSLWARGGNGGNGGRGGDGTAIASTTVINPVGIQARATARGGNGGYGGLAGIQSAAGSIFDGFSGQDGSGGQGGNASASASASNPDNSGGAAATASAIGGTGGDISPNNRLGLSQGFEPVRSSAAGDGGSASLGTVYAESLGRGSVTTMGSVVGGNGGSVSNNTQSGGSASGTIRSGNGASISLTDAVDGSTGGSMFLDQNATGGAAGSHSTETGYGALGNAGSASSSLSKTTTSDFVADTLTVRTRAVGGKGGDFTILNLIPVDGLPPIMGSAIGGDGATATAFSSAINMGGNATANATAEGGKGGDARSLVNGAELSGGNGGGAVATAYAESLGGTAWASAAQIGGSGSLNPFAQFSSNGAGADSVMVDAVSGRSDVLLKLEQLAVGGRGGNGGNASSLLTASNPGGGDITGLIEATGGDGLDNSGAAGGDATAAADLTAQEDVTVIATSTGGNAANSRDALTRINGGNADLGLVTGTSLNGGAVVVNGVATGGNGGYFSPSDFGANSGGGNGAGISLVDIVNGSTTGTLRLTQNAWGGAGGSADNRARDALYGLGGEAFSSLTRATSEATELAITVSASGGAGGNVKLGVAADGALATANASGINTGGDSNISGGAVGGRGGAAENTSGRGRDFSAGRGGNAISTADSTVVDGTFGTDATVKAYSTGGTGGSVIQVSGGVINNLTTEGGDGGNASSVATATANSTLGFGTLSSLSNAIGGLGGDIRSERIAQGGDGGDAFARATSIFNAQRTNIQVTANASARGGGAGVNLGGGLDGRSGSATAIAEVIGAANALSTATATPGTRRGGVKRLVTGSASATAIITNGSGTAQAQIKDRYASSTGLFVTQSTVTATTQSRTPLASSNVEASVTVAGDRSGSVATSANTASVADMESVSRVAILPDTTTISQELNGNADIASNFDLTGGSDLLALMTIGAMQDGSLDANSFANDISLSLDMSQLSTQQDLIFGFMNPVFTGNGFDSMTFQIFQEDLLVVDESFADVFSAESFFTDQTLNLGDWTQGLTGDLDLAFLIDFSISQAGDGFYFDTIYGNSTIGSGLVPVPAAVWLFATGLIGLVAVARRRKDGNDQHYTAAA